MIESLVGGKWLMHIYLSIIKWGEMGVRIDKRFIGFEDFRLREWGPHPSPLQGRGRCYVCASSYGVASR